MKTPSTSSFVRKIIRQIQSSSPFFESMIAFFVCAGTILVVFSKASIHLSINQFHSSFSDSFFRTITILGDGITATIIVIVLLFIRFRFALMMAASNIACSLIVQSLKRFFFINAVRPHEFFKGMHSLYLVPGVEVYSFNSFPSGHSATIVTTCALLCCMVKRKSVRALLFILALLVAFSRVYLSQHFLGDIYAGSIIGFIAAYITAAIFNEEQSVGSRLDQSLTTIFNKR